MTPRGQLTGVVRAYIQRAKKFRAPTNLVFPPRRIVWAWGKEHSILCCNLTSLQLFFHLCCSLPSLQLSSHQCCDLPSSQLLSCLCCDFDRSCTRRFHLPSLLSLSGTDQKILKTRQESKFGFLPRQKERKTWKPNQGGWFTPRLRQKDCFVLTERKIWKSNRGGWFTPGLRQKYLFLLWKEVSQL